MERKLVSKKFSRRKRINKVLEIRKKSDAAASLFFCCQETVSGPSLHRALSDDLECHYSRGHADVEGVDVAWHRDDEMVIDTFQIRLADAVFLRSHHDGDRSCEVGLPYRLLAFLRKRYHFQSAGLQEVYGVFYIFDSAHIN